MALRQYEYQKLHNPFKEIRLLTVHACGYGEDPVVNCSMSVYDISMKQGRRASKVLRYMRLPIYFAVSHVWGTGAALNMDHNIYIDGKALPVTKAIYDGLKIQLGAVPITVWVDSICINQADDKEKSAQIPLMLEVYRLATVVAVWLGDGTPETTKALRFIAGIRSVTGWSQTYTDVSDTTYIANQRKAGMLQRIKVAAENVAMRAALPVLFTLVLGVLLVAESYDNPQYVLPQDLSTGNSLLAEDLLNRSEVLENWEPKGEGLKFLESHGANLQEMADLLIKVLVLDTQYFTRMWTLQETAVGKITIVVYGIDGVLLGEALQVLFYLGTHHGISIPDGILDDLLKMINIEVYWHKKRRLPLWRLLHEFSSRQCIDPRDRIYALQSLMRDPVDDLLRSDYSKSVEEVYSNATRHFTADRESLDVICGHRYEKGIRSLPSWVPDYQFHGKEPNSLIRIDHFDSIYNASPSKYHNPDRPDSTTSLNNWHLLRCSGFSLGSIIALSEKADPASATDLGWKHWYAVLKSAGQASPQKLLALERVSALLDLCSRIIAADVSLSTPPDLTSVTDTELALTKEINDIRSQDQNEAGYAIEYLLTAICGRRGPNERCHDVDEKLTRACIRDSEDDNVLPQLISSLKLGMKSRRLAILKSGEIAAVPNQSEVGDLIHILIGCSVPVVLRHKDGHSYEFVGECYVHGVMDGEAIERKDKRMYKTQRIVLT